MCKAAVGSFVAMFLILWHHKKYKQYVIPHPKDPPKKIIWIWLAIIALFSGLLLFAVQTNNRVLTQILSVIYIAFGLYVVGRINKENRKSVHIENTGWREGRGTIGIPIWEKVIKFLLFITFIFFLGCLYFCGSNDAY